jgi:hypothetical protein
MTDEMAPAKPTQVVPVPTDPTVLTRALIREGLDNLKEQIVGRLDAMDKAASMLHEDYVRVPTLLDRAVKETRELLTAKIYTLESVFAEKFTRIETQFVERDRRTEQLSLADKTAVAAALQAAKEAVGAQNTSNSIAIAKSESSTVESIKQLQALFTSSIAALQNQVTDIKERIDRGEGHARGIGDGWGYLVGAAGAVWGIVATIEILTRHTQ